MQVINASKTKTSKGKQSMKAGILVFLWDMVYIYFKASSSHPCSLALIHLPVRTSNVSLNPGVKQNNLPSRNFSVGQRNLFSQHLFSFSHKVEININTSPLILNLMSGRVSLVTDFLSSILRGNCIRQSFPIFFTCQPRKEFNIKGTLR